MNGPSNLGSDGAQHKNGLLRLGFTQIDSHISNNQDTDAEETLIKSIQQQLPLNWQYEFEKLADGDFVVKSGRMYEYLVRDERYESLSRKFLSIIVNKLKKDNCLFNSDHSFAAGLLDYVVFEHRRM